MKNILGLDLGTNSLGSTVITGEIRNNNLELVEILMSASRIIPMDAGTLGKFDSGVTESQTAERTTFRGIRRLRERHLLRRERLHRVLHIMTFLPDHYSNYIDWKKRLGKFTSESECKLPWRNNKDKDFEFLFQNSFNEMLVDFSESQPQLVEAGKKVPYDWTIYYLRKKALTDKISKEELAWIILNFNQKRGYYQLRGEEEELENKKLIEFHALKVVKVEATDQKKGKDIWYNVHLENGWIYRRASGTELDWEDKIKEFIVTTDLDDQGQPKKDKDGVIKRSFRAPKEDDWNLVKKKTELEIDHSDKMVGEYIYDTLLQNPYQKIRGRLIHTIERKYYKKELVAIIEKQKEFHPELQDKQLYLKCVAELYQSNINHRESIANKDFTYLFVNDIIFYQRPLKSKKSLISNCTFETYQYRDKESKELKTINIKCIAKSNPFYQEFRLWQFISNLRILEREKEVAGKLKMDVDVTNEFLSTYQDYAKLFDWLNDRKGIKQNTLLQSFFKLKKAREQDFQYRWNYIEDKEYPCNETRYLLLNKLEKADVSSSFITPEIEYHLWHILYSVEDKNELEKALNTFKEKNELPDIFVDIFKNIPSIKKEYGAYSEKAVKKILSVIRQGHHWSVDNINANVLERIEKLITGEYDEKIRTRVREKAINLTKIEHFQGLPIWLASYVVYDRHSEAQDISKWHTPEELDNFIKSFKQHSLRNPIVEQIILETLRTVCDIWKKIGHIDEIHIELGREMKNSNDKRKRLTQTSLDNENTNLRIKRLLMEFMNPEYEIENVRSYSPSQQDILKIYEEYVLNSEERPDDIDNILKKFRECDVKKQPSKSEIMKYKLWLEQKYRSPYTGDIIPLGKLFTEAYEIEHIIPRSRFFDDSFSNKVICEAEVNKLKSNQLAYEFIKNPNREEYCFIRGRSVKIFTTGEYEEFVKVHYSRSKMTKLLMDEIPEQFIQRQLNDSRYISKYITNLLSNIVREEDEEDAISKNVVVCTGGVTDRLKKDWGINDIWNDIIIPRFERLNEKSGSNQFTSYNDRVQKNLPTMPLELQKGFNKKRIDHRHHAMDSIVIACASRSIVNYLNNASASKNARTSRHDLQNLLCDKCYTDNNGNYSWKIKKPWTTFTEDSYKVLSSITCSFKQNLRIINKSTNYFQHYNEKGEKVFSKQTKGDNWAIRKPLHQETVSGNVNLRKIKPVRLATAVENPSSIVDKRLKFQILSLLELKYDEKKIGKYFKDHNEEWENYDLKKINVYYFTNETGNKKDRLVATRKSLDTTFNAEKIKGSITDTGIQKILLNHLERYEGKADLAFSQDGIDKMNVNIKEFNGGKHHHPIFKVRVYEPQGTKFTVGYKGSKKDKYVIAAKGTNLFFAIYQTEAGKRVCESVPLELIIERQKQGLQSVPEMNENGNKLLFSLSPNNLVYIPSKDEMETKELNGDMDNNRIYKMVSCTGNEGHFIPVNIATPILQTIELGSNNKAQRSWENEMIKEVCIPIKINRLGEITTIGKYL